VVWVVCVVGVFGCPPKGGAVDVGGGVCLVLVCKNRFWWVGRVGGGGGGGGFGSGVYFCVFRGGVLVRGGVCGLLFVGVWGLLGCFGGVG